MNSRRGMLAAISAGVLVASLGLASGAHAEPVAREVLTGGIVVDSSGRPASGAVVEAYAWPSNDVLAAMRPGTHFDLMPVARAQVSASGTYTLGAEGDALARFRDKHGNLNLEVVIRSGSGIATESVGLQRASRPDTRGIRWLAPRRAGRLVLKPAGATAAVAAGPVPCGAIYVGDMGNHLVWVGGHYSTTTGVSHDLEYTNGSTSSLGVGFSLSGKVGSYSASGTTSVTASGTINFPSTTGRQHDYTYFNYDKYRVGCTGLMRYQVRATSWVGGASTWVPPTAPPATYCFPYAAGVTFTKQTTSAYMFSTGADLSAAIGIDLSSQTGYSTSTKVTFHFASNRHLCGTSGPPGSSPGRLVAKS